MITAANKRLSNITSWETQCFVGKLSPPDNNGCVYVLTRTGRKKPMHDGYVMTWLKNMNVYAHRFAYYIYNPNDREIMLSTDSVVDHVCKNRQCVAQEHLRLVSHSINNGGLQEELSPKGAPKTHIAYKYLAENPDRFLNIEKLQMGNCSYLLNKPNTKGYVYIEVKCIGVRAHVASYISAYPEELNRLLRGDLVVDHICKNRACVNPLHLRLVSQSVNSMRS